jgi:hypothetical protein
VCGWRGALLESKGDGTMIAENIAKDKGEADLAESLLQNVEEKVRAKSGFSLFHILTVASIATSIFLFLRGNKLGAIFVGLWPPTLQALKSASQNRR